MYVYLGVLNIYLILSYIIILIEDDNFLLHPESPASL